LFYIRVQARDHRSRPSDGTIQTRPRRGGGAGDCPPELRGKLGLKKGDLVAVVETNEGVLIAPEKTVVNKALDRIGEILRQEGLTLEELIESGREIRAELIREQYGSPNKG